MFGRNKPRGLEKGEDIQVTDVFYTIQGEGPFAGRPAVFIRLTGCNLKCHFCDTKWDDEGDAYKSAAEIADMADKAQADSGQPFMSSLVVITGGEPTRWPLGDLIAELFEVGFETIQIETAGTFYQECFDDYRDVHVVISPKTGKVNAAYYDGTMDRSRISWKYVVRAGEVDEKDGLPSAPMQRGPNDRIVGGIPARPPVGRGDRVYLQPCDDYDLIKNAENLRAMVASSLTFGHTAGVQLHKQFNLE